MIIVISGKQGDGKSTFANALITTVFPQNPVVIEGLPKKKPVFLGSMTIFTCQHDDDLPKWLIKRSDYTLINISRLKSNLPQNWIQPA